MAVATSRPRSRRRSGLEPAVAGVEQGVEILDQIGVGGDAGGGAGAAALEPQLARAEQGRDHRALAGDAAALGLDQQARLPRVGGEAQHAAADGGDRAGLVDGAEAAQQLVGGGGRGRRRGLEPGEVGEAREAGGVQLERGLGEIGARDLGRVVLAPGVVIVLGVQAQRAAGAGAAGAAGALGGAGPRDRLDDQAGEARPRRVARHPGEPASITATTPSIVTEVSATLVARITLRRSARATARSCSSAERSPCSGNTSRSARGRQLGQVLGGAADLAGAGQEHQHVAVEPLVDQAPHRRRHLLAHERSSGGGTCSTSTGNVRPSDTITGAARNAATGSGSSVADITTSLRSGRAPRRSRWHSASARSPARWRSWNSSRITTPMPRSVGSPSSWRVRTPSVTKRMRVVGVGALVEADLVADLVAEAGAALAGHPRRRQACREPPRLEHDDLAAAGQPGVEQRARDPGGLAGARRRHQHRGAVRRAPPRPARPGPRRSATATAARRAPYSTCCGRAFIMGARSALMVASNH